MAPSCPPIEARNPPVAALPAAVPIRVRAPMIREASSTITSAVCRPGRAREITPGHRLQEGILSAKATIRNPFPQIEGFRAALDPSKEITRSMLPSP